MLSWPFPGFTAQRLSEDEPRYLGTAVDLHDNDRLTQLWALLFQSPKSRKDKFLGFLAKNSSSMGLSEQHMPVPRG